MGLQASIYETKLAYGVILRSDPKGRSKKMVIEKPSIKANINMGCYSNGCQAYVEYKFPKGRPYGMDDVIKKVMRSKKNIDIAVLTSDQKKDLPTLETRIRIARQFFTCNCSKLLGKI